MNWDAHIARWSRSVASLLNICQYTAEDEIVCEGSIAGTGFFVLVTQGRAGVHQGDRVQEVFAPYVLHGEMDRSLVLTPQTDDFGCYLLTYVARYDEQLSLVQEKIATYTPLYGFTLSTLLPLQEKCRSMLHLWQQADLLDQLQAQSLFLPFVHEVLRQGRSMTNDQARRNIATEAIRYIHAYYREAITAEDLAGMYGCSTSYLSRLFKNQIGMGPIEYLIHVRIRNAKRFLLHSDTRLQEIASSVGYADVYYFSRLFKKHTGYSPLQYRDRKREEVQNNPSSLSKSSIVSPSSISDNDNEICYQLVEEGDTSMFGFSKSKMSAVMLLCTALLLSACQTGGGAGGASAGVTNTPQPQPTIAATDNEEAATTRVYEHLNGKTDIPVKPERVVTLFHLGEIMALGVKPVGATTYVMRNPLLKDIEGITDVGVPPDAEAILSLDPDLIITTAPFAEIVEGGYEALKQIAPTIVVEQHNDPIKDTEMFGDILGKQEEAKERNEAFIAKIADYKEKAREYIGEDETFSILNVRSNAVFIYGDSNMGGNIIYKYLGLKPTEKVESDVIKGETWEISREAIPEFIGDHLLLAVNEGAEGDMKEIEKLIQNTSAWQKGNVYPINFSEFLYSDPISVDQQLDIILDLIAGKNSK